MSSLRQKPPNQRQIHGGSVLGSQRWSAMLWVVQKRNMRGPAHMSSMLNMCNAPATPEERQPMRVPDTQWGGNKKSKSSAVSCSSFVIYMAGFSTPYKRPRHHLPPLLQFFFLKFRLLERHKVCRVNEYVYMYTCARHTVGSQGTGNFECRSLVDIHLWHKTTCDQRDFFVPVSRVLYHFHRQHVFFSWQNTVLRPDRLAGDSSWLKVL